MQKIINFFSGVDRVFAKFVKSLLIVILLSMVGFVVLQVVLRNVFYSGISWADVATRHMVLWVAFLGAMLATRSRQHISIDALTRMIPRKARNAVRIALDMLSCVVSIILAKAALAFVLEERAMGAELFIGIPTWVAQVIIPFGFAMIAIEYAIGVCLDIHRIVKDGDRHVAGKGRE
ncbi:MAG: TRAP transporter small permease [Deltaproteobacteria bacterium]|nr:TRAP transporter small permease [Deltaproteobacteria bacterium]